MTALRTDTVEDDVGDYQIELDFFTEGRADALEQRCFSSVSYIDPGTGLEYHGSLNLLDAYGWLDCATDGEAPHEVSAGNINRLREWAEENGY